MISSPAPGQAKLDWKAGWGTGNQVIVTRAEGLIAPASCSVANGGVNLGNVLTLTQTGLNSGKYTYRVCTSDGAVMSDGIVMSVDVAGWVQQAYIKAANVEVNEYFGLALALSSETLAVGVSYEDSNQTGITNGATASADNSKSQSGAVYVYRRVGANWDQEAYIKAVNVDSSDYFGSVVSLSGETLAVGAPYEDSNQTTITNGSTASADNSKGQSGAVYVYRRTGVNWAQEAYIKTVNADGDDHFGSILSLSGDTFAVGVQDEGSNQTSITNGATASADNSKSQSGAVYVYRRVGVNWAQEAYIKATNADADDQFGFSVSLSGDSLAVVANEEDSNQTTITNGSTASTDNSNFTSGAVYVYRRVGVNWAQEAYIKAANAASSAYYFGDSVSLSGDSLAVGVKNEDSNQTTITNGSTASADNSKPVSGAVYVYRRSGVNWVQEAYIKAANADENDGLGSSVSLSGDTLAVGAAGESSNQTIITNGVTASADNSFSNSGAVYVYRRTGVNWVQEAYIKATNADSGDSFGYCVSLSGDALAVGAAGEDSNQTTITNGVTASADNSLSGSGAVYIYQNTSRLFEVADLTISSPGVGEIKLDWKGSWGTGNQVIVAKLIGDTAPVDCIGGTNLGNVLTKTDTGLTSSSRYTYRVCVSDGTNMTAGIVLSTVVN